MEEKEIKEKKEAWEFPLATRTKGREGGPNETKREGERKKGKIVGNPYAE